MPERFESYKLLIKFHMKEVLLEKEIKLMRERI